ncbi:MAG: peptide/nickel transport system permease protein [Petroclostridium sp.]|jgi:peptide/nickel transport system permease protein|uniref:ABC transporter permease n=1 Tax=Petroclostridium xylanilyticum TaxID=1792311 RepID=UPI000B98779E|nr:ABC transporter permease [Petroclostridium xylanilyticum]MBZ4645816.1 gsiC [Clostridia bacterium]MDK2811514.1 peptide/nickel transport system permease protein [Petroclostridium sp.]
MGKGLLKKASEYLITFFIIITLNFFIPRLMPGDPFTFLSSAEGQITVTYTEEQINKYKAYYGLDKPLLVQYASYITNLFKGNLGYSIYYNDSVVRIIGKRIPWTVSIVIASIILSCLVGTILGSWSAWHRNGIPDKVIYAVMIPISEIPSFLIGILFLFILAAKLGIFPLSGGMSTFAKYNNSAEKAMDIIHHAVLPVLTLSMTRLGEFYLLSRNSMVSVLSKDYIRTAKAKGLNKVRIIFRHALKNAMLPIVTRVFLSLGAVFGGAILVENVFSYPGLGRLMREAVMVRDYVLIQGIFIFMAIMVLTMNLLADILYVKLDPRVS